MRIWLPAGWKPLRSTMPVKKNHLKFTGLQPRTLAAYRKALEHFMGFVKAKKLKLATARHLDLQASEYLNMMFLEGEALSAAGHLLSAIKRFMPEYRLHLPISSQFHRNWQRQHKPVRAIPLPLNLVEALGAVCFTVQEPELGLLVTLSFHCFLRTAEMLSLQWNHLLVQSDQRTINVVLPFSKTSEGNPQVLRLEDSCLWKVLQKLRPVHRPQRLLWPHSVQAFHRVWKRLLPCLGFDAASYAPYGLRRGGATHHFLTLGQMDLTVARGRWAHAKTAKLYIDDGALALAETLWTSKQKRLVRKMARKFVPLCTQLRQ